MDVGGEGLDLYWDTGGNSTIITPAMYKRSMGKVGAARSYLRAGSKDGYLETKGMSETTLNTSSGATKRTWVYAYNKPGTIHNTVYDENDNKIAIKGKTPEDI